MNAGESIAAAATLALASVEELGGVYDGPPLQASIPYAVIETGPEIDWGHKSGEGRELRLAVTIRDQGERPTRLRRLMGEAETVLGALDGELGGWRLVTMRFLRGRLVRESKRGAWAGVIEFRARMLAG